MVFWRGEMFRARAKRPERLGDPTYASLARDAAGVAIFYVTLLGFLASLIIAAGVLIG